ncbi:MAG: hypothetical protein VXX82_06660 [Verrucomicrobiota bacterium]|nr:hypothetical protein [Verrucomicrobiota bacterium]MEC8650595.1 hypothetical protein [Verrucomicrobiota bacterium]
MRLLILFVLVPIITHSQGYISAEDEAFYTPYNDGWSTGDNGGRGFGPWLLIAPDYLNEDQEQKQYNGFFIANSSRESNLSKVAREGNAFGIFANGTGFEETLAFRSFGHPLCEGDIFSFRFEFDGFEQKFNKDSDAGYSTVGVIFRNSEIGNTVEDLSQGRSLVFAAIKGLSTYQVLDAGGRFNTGIFLDPEGVEISVTLKKNMTYDLQIITLSKNIIHNIEGRALIKEFNTDNNNQRAESVLRGFALFNLNGGLNNAYYGSFQILRKGD